MKINLLINDKNYIYNIEKLIYGKDTEYDLDIFQLQITINDVKYISSKSFDCMEYAIINLQKQLPNNIHIVCCQSCKYGNFCPYGDAENEIFCLIDYNPKDKMDVANIFTEFWAEKEVLQRNELLYWCEKYQKINNDYFTYNDWAYIF